MQSKTSLENHLKVSIGKTYDPIDGIFRLMLGEYPCITNSWPGDYGPPTRDALERAQGKKHQAYFDRLGLKSGMVVLDVGAGWGAFMEFCRERGVYAVGLTPATAQYEHLVRQGFEAYHGVWQNYTTEHKFDAVVAIGSPEHFVSPQDHLAGRQEEIYADLFKFVDSVLKPSGRFGGQFMDFNGSMPDYRKISVKAPKGSRYYHFGLLEYFYPSSWLPRDFNHFYYRSGGFDFFKVIEVVDGRVQYIWTMQCWAKEFSKLKPFSKWPKVVKLILRSWTDPEFRYWAKAFWEKSNRLSFEKGWMGHKFFFLRKRD